MPLTFTRVEQLLLVSRGGRVVEGAKQTHHPQPVHKPSLQRRWKTQEPVLPQAPHQGARGRGESWRADSSHEPYLVWAAVRKYSTEELPREKCYKHKLLFAGTSSWGSGIAAVCCSLVPRPRIRVNNAWHGIKATVCW